MAKFEQQLIAEWERQRDDLLAELAMLAFDIAYSIVHVLTGLLRSTIKTDVSDNSVVLSYDTPYAELNEARFATLETAAELAVDTLATRYGS